MVREGQGEKGQAQARQSDPRPALLAYLPAASDLYLTQQSQQLPVLSPGRLSPVMGLTFPSAG